MHRHLETLWKNLEGKWQLPASNENCHRRLTAAAITKRVKGEDSNDLMLTIIDLYRFNDQVVFFSCIYCFLRLLLIKTG